MWLLLQSAIMFAVLASKHPLAMDAERLSRRPYWNRDCICGNVCCELGG
jgi:hypothetical protein